jgi:hypothetical protein
MIGAGEVTLTIAAIPFAVTEVAVGPRSRIKVVLTLRVTVTRARFTGSVGERLTPGAAEASGKSTYTVSLALPPKPLMRAYTQGVFGSAVPQVNAVVGKLAPPEVFVLSKTLMIAACAAASAAAWAICRWAYRCDPSIPNPIAPMRNKLIASRTRMMTWPRSRVFGIVRTPKM